MPEGSNTDNRDPSARGEARRSYQSFTQPCFRLGDAKASTVDAPENPPAFPRDERYLGHNGMTLRDWFAGQALPGIAARGEKRSRDQAGAAYQIADAMLAERERRS